MPDPLYNMTMLMENLSLTVAKIASEKLTNADALADSIFITGMSGAGKSTLANSLANKYDMPILSTDNHPGIRAIMKRFKGNDTPDLAGDKKYLRNIRDQLQDFVDNVKSPSIIEGSFFLEAPKTIPKESRKIYVDVSDDIIFKRRLQREIEKKILKGKDSPEVRQGLAVFTRHLTDYYKPFAEKFKNMPGVEVLDNTQDLAKVASIADVDLERYLKLYDSFDPAHDRRHAETVKRYASQLANNYMPDQIQKAELAAVLHDIGLAKDRDMHEQYGAEMVRSDKYLKSMLPKTDIIELANAVARHRASTGNAQTLLDKIISDSDRLSSENMLRRAYDYRSHHMPEMSDEEKLLEAARHVSEKFGPGGRGTRTYLPESESIIIQRSAPVIQALNNNDLDALRQLLG